MLLVDTCHSPVREDRWMTGFFFFLMLKYELRQRKCIKVSLPTLVVLFTLIQSSVARHCLQTEPWGPAVAEEGSKTCWGIFCNQPYYAIPIHTVSPAFQKYIFHFLVGKKPNTLYIFLQAKTIWSGGIRCQAASARMSHNKLHKR